MHPNVQRRRSGLRAPPALPARRWTRRGSLLVLMPILLVLVLSLGLLAVDVGRIYVAKSQLQSAADAAALAAAAALGDPAANSVQEATEAAADNRVLGKGISLASSDVTYGTWDPDSRTFTALAGSQANLADAIRVVARGNAAQESAVELMFGSLLGLSAVDVKAQAIATKDRLYTGFVGINSVTLTGNTRIDSYVATDGSYDSGKRSRATVMSNGPISIGSNVIIAGDARPGPGYSAVGGNVTGTRSALPRKIDWPPVSSDEYSGYDNGPIGGMLTGANLNIASDTNVVFPAGTYLVHNFNLTGKGKLHAAGKVRIYVTGSLHMGGGSSTSTNLPGDLEIRVIGSGSVAFEGSSDFYGHVYAPQSNLELKGTSGYYGMFVGKTMNMVGTSEAHNDESVRTSLHSRLVW